MVSVEHLTKKYGEFTAVSDLSFEIDEGGVYGFLGPNGAGKSTTMNIMTGCLSATDGHVRIGGHDIFDEPDQAKRLIGYLPEQPPLYLNETPAEYLRFVGEAKGIRGQRLAEQLEEVIRQTRIEEVKDKLIAKLSKGYKQRVGIAQALLGNPKVIILDEPTVGLDPIQIIEIRDLIRQLGREHTVILSSHILSEVQTICEKVLIIAKGKLIAFDEPEKLEKHLLSSNQITFVAEAEREVVDGILEKLELVPEEVTGGTDGCLTVRVKPGQRDTNEICRALFFAFAEKKKPLLGLTCVRANLENVFVELTEVGSAAGEAAERGVGGKTAGKESAEEAAEQGIGERIAGKEPAKEAAKRGIGGMAAGKEPAGESAEQESAGADERKEEER
ncbi:MAG: ATP-binding cassette domain-containing protein [Roseburia sp.]|nr:ATP-binding cassette domain-containing protein [Roseburia sp.]MCM1099274.1 ATP-binding cassette domain-containing protein [Ruminococcus flavefaciens]